MGAGRLAIVILATGTVMIAVLAAGCRHGEASTEVERPIIVSARNPHGGDACNPRRVAEIALDLFDSVNRGDEERLDLLFPRSLFDWYAVGSGAGQRSSEILDRTGRSNPYDRDALIAYFADRHERGERLRLVELRVNGAATRTALADGEPIPPTLMAGVESRLLRSADDFQAGEPVSYHAKGLIACRLGAVSMWSMGDEEGLRLKPLCPEPARKTEEAVLTC